MERLGLFIFFFFWFGLSFFERARTQGETGSFWVVFLRNGGIIAFAIVCYFLWGTDMVFRGETFELFGDFKSFFDKDTTPNLRLVQLLAIWRNSLYCSVATLIVSAGIWELKIHCWKKWVLVAGFTLIVFPLFGHWTLGDGFLERAGFYDFKGALIMWVLPAIYVLGSRLSISKNALPDEREHSLKGYKVLPGMKHRFFVSRGIGLTMVFLVLNATTLVDQRWIVSKTTTLVPASLTLLFCNFLFFGLFGKIAKQRPSYAPPFFAVMATLVATQACNAYTIPQAVIASVSTTFVTLLYLRLIPLKLRFWDPICSVPIFIFGGSMGILMASLTSKAQPGPQLFGIGVCLLFGLVSGALLALFLRLFRSRERGLEIAE